MYLERFCHHLESSRFVKNFGKVKKVKRDSIRTNLSNARVGSLCMAEGTYGHIPLEVVSLDPKGHIAMPLDELRGIRLGDLVGLTENISTFPMGNSLLGKVVDSVGISYEDNQPVSHTQRIPLYGPPMNPLKREIISTPLDLGVRALNACLTTGRGQRQGIFSGSGVGKSVLLGMMAKFTEAEVVVIALIGERGREVREFIERDLGPGGRKKSVVVVETADKSAVRRVRGAYAAAAVSEYFCQQGKHVLLLMDSLTRFAMAQREIGFFTRPSIIFFNLSRIPGFSDTASQKVSDTSKSEWVPVSIFGVK